MNTNEMEEVIPELGDLITIVSELYGRLTGRIVYRDAILIRVKPYQASDRAIEFPIDENTGLFQDSLGVSEIVLHSKRRSPYFSKQLAVLPGNVLEFYTSDSKVAAQKGVVKQVIAKGKDDSILLEDGRKLDFHFIGPPSPISIIIPRAPEISAENESGRVEETEEGIEEELSEMVEESDISDEVIEAIDDMFLPSSEIEIIPTTELRYNDSVQLQDMYTDLMNDLNIKMQKNRKIKTALKNQAKYFLDLKNEIYKNEGAILEYYTPQTLLESIKKQVNYKPLNSVIPIAKLRRNIFIDDESFETQQIVAKNEARNFALIAEAAVMYDSKSSSGGVSNKYTTYMNTIFSHNRGISSGSGQLSGKNYPVMIDQTVLRTPIFPTQPQGLVSNLPPGRKVGTFGGAQKQSQTQVNLNFIGKIKHQTYRVLTNMTIEDPKTKYKLQIAPPDYIDPAAYMLLTPDLTEQRASIIRSGVLIYDIQRSEKLRDSIGFIHSLYENMDGITIIRDENDDIQLSDLIDEHLDIVLTKNTNKKILSYNDINLWTILDNLGLQTFEYDEKIMNILNNKIQKGINQFDADFAIEKEKGMQSQSKSSIPVISNVFDGNSSFFSVIDSNEKLKQLADNIRSNEITLGGNDLLLVNEIEKVGMETSRSLLYANLAANERPDVFKQIEKSVDNTSENVESGEETVKENGKENELGEKKNKSEKSSLPSDLPPEPSGLIERLSNEFEREIYRQNIEQTNKQIILVHNEPIINTCEHVNKLNIVNAIKSEAERFYLLEKLIEKYQYGLNGNWITCNICKLNLVCKHELLMIEEFKNELGSDVLHKALLLQFGEKGNFGSDYCCKNCGQTIGELDFDSRIEFDDDGKPMVGRSIINPSDLKDGLNPVDVISELLVNSNETDVMKLTPAEQNIFHPLQTMFESAGAALNQPMYIRIIKQIYEYVQANERNEYAITFATYTKAKRQPPKREVFSATFLLSVISAFVIIELQISENSLPINIPYPHCVFSRDGYPRDGDDPKTVSNGLVDYIVCILANIDREDSPYIDTLWSAETIGSTRRTALVKQTVLGVLKNMKKLPTIGDALQKAKNEYDKRVVAGQLVGVSKDDRLPFMFRPAPTLKGASEGVEAVPAFTNIDMFKKSVVSDPIESIRPLVERRELILAQQVIEQYHDNALKTAKERVGQSKRMDGHCCETSIFDAEKKGLGVGSLESINVSNEIDVVRSALKAIQIRDPALPSAGSHFITVWSAKPIEPFSIEPDSSIYFRLFFKACASGSNIGSPHEYGTDNICRRCNLYFPKEIPFLSEEEITLYQKIAESDGKKREIFESRLEKLLGKRNELYQKSLADIGIVVSPESFAQLQDNIRAVKHIIPPKPITIEKSSYGFDLLSELIKKTDALHSTYLDDWKELLEFIAKDSELKDEAREIKFGNFVSKYDLLKNIFVSQFISLADNVRTQAVFMKEQMNANLILQYIDQIVQNDDRAPRLLLTMFVAPTKQIASGMKIEVNAASWFPTIPPKHKEELDKYWKKHYDSVQEINNLLEEDENLKVVVQTAFDRLSGFLGPVFQTFLSEIRGDQLLTHKELSFVIGWFLRSAFCSGLSESSALYAGSPSIDISLQACKIFKKYIITTFKYISNKLNMLDMSEERIKNAISARNALEREYFITRQEVMTKEESDADKIFKSLGIGPYSQGALKDNFKYDADYFEFHRAQRSDYKLPDFLSDVSNKPSAAKDDYGLGFVSGDSSAYGVGESGGHYDTSMDE